MSAAGPPRGPLRERGDAGPGERSDGSAAGASPRASLAARLETAGLDWIVPRWPVPASVQAFVTTRAGGVSGGAALLDLGQPATAAPADAAAIAENLRRVRAFLPSSPVWLAQVHGADAIVVDRAHRDGALPSSDASPPRADAAVTRDTDVVLAVRVADCLPVLFADRAGTSVGIAHAGWRGLAAGVLESTLAAMRCDPSRLVAWLGPAIGASAFEVGADVRDAFVAADAGAAAAFVAGPPGKWRADLEALARMRLARAGVTSVHGGGMCTVSDPGRFFSFRRDRATARMAAFLWRAGAPA